MGRTWRDIAAPIIADVLRETKGKEEKEIKKALFEAYPFNERQYHPYKIWLDEIKRQRALKNRRVAGSMESKGQTKLF
jgi:hypothetical protein